MESGDQIEWINETDNEKMEVILPDENQLVSIIGNNLGDNTDINSIEYYQWSYGIFAYWWSYCL